MALARQKPTMLVRNDPSQIPGHGPRDAGILLAMLEADLHHDLSRAKAPQPGHATRFPDIAPDAFPGRPSVAGHHLAWLGIGQEEADWGIMGCILVMGHPHPGYYLTRTVATSLLSRACDQALKPSPTPVPQLTDLHDP